MSGKALIRIVDFPDPGLNRTRFGNTRTGSQFVASLANYVTMARKNSLDYSLVPNGIHPDLTVTLGDEDMIQELAQEYMDHLEHGKSKGAAKNKWDITRVVNTKVEEFFQPYTILEAIVQATNPRSTMEELKNRKRKRRRIEYLNQDFSFENSNKQFGMLPMEICPIKGYQIGWIKKGLAHKVTKICKVPLAIGKHYNELVTCDVVDMEACHVLLERPWQHESSMYKSLSMIYKIAVLPPLSF
ncbi:hypothetical protein Tco_0640454 [Tanacetum coccineum]